MPLADTEMPPALTVAQLRNDPITASNAPPSTIMVDRLDVTLSIENPPVD
jgi:hypothetical protein